MKPSRASLQIFAIYAKSHSPREIVRTSGARNAPIVGSKKKTQPTGRLRTLDVSGIGNLRQYDSLTCYRTCCKKSLNL